MVKHPLPESPYYTVQEVAALLKIHRRSVIRMYMGYTVKNPDGTSIRKRPVLAAVHVGGAVRIRKTDLDKFIRERTSVVG